MNPLSLIIGNLCSLLAMITDSISSTRKSAKEVLLIQSLSQLIYGIGTAALKGYSGVVQNAVSILRNLIAIRNIESKFLEWFLVALGVVLGVCFNNLGLIGYLPVIANLEYTLAVFRFKGQEKPLKIAFFISVSLFALFNLAIYNFVGVASNLVVLGTTLIFLLKDKA